MYGLDPKGLPSGFTRVSLQERFLPLILVLVWWDYQTHRFAFQRLLSYMHSLPTSAAAASLQSCPTLRDPRDGSPPGSPTPGILQARTLEWVAISFSNARKWKVKVKSISRVQLFETPWTVAHQAPPSMGFSRPEYWSVVPLPSLTKVKGIQNLYKTKHWRKKNCTA